MELDKRKKGVLLGSFWGIVGQLVLMVFTFITRSVFLQYFSVEMLGYNSLFADMVGVLSFAELGLGASITLALYKPVADHDHYRIAAVANMLNRIYQLIALLVLALGLGMIIFMESLVKDPVKDISLVRMGFFLYLLSAFFGYFFLPHKNYLAVLQEGYIIEICNMVGNMLSTLLKLLILVLTQNYLLFLVMQFAGMIIANMYYPYYIRKRYPYLHKYKDAKLEPNERKSLISNSWKMVYYQLSGTAINYTDNMITSIFLGVTVVGYFANYKNIINMIGLLVRRILASLSNAIGSFATERGPDATLEMLHKLTFFCYFTGSICCAGLVGCINPFITLWLGDAYLYDFLPSVVSFVNLYMVLILTPLANVFNISKCYIAYRYIPILEVVINLVISIVLVRYLGLTGIFLGTLICYFASFVLKSRAIFRDYFQYPLLPFLTKNIVYFLLNLAVMGLVYVSTGLIVVSNPFLVLVLRLLVSMALALGINCLIFWRTKEFQYYLNFCRELLSKFIRRKGDEL